MRSCGVMEPEKQGLGVRGWEGQGQVPGPKSEVRSAGDR